MMEKTRIKTGYILLNNTLNNHFIILLLILDHLMDLVITYPDTTKKMSYPKYPLSKRVII